MSYKWKPSKAAKNDFAKKMNEIEIFCNENNISKSMKGDSYYFTLNNINYRISNHSIEASNSHAYDSMNNQIREKYHNDKRDENTIYIHASKTRIIEIYNNLKAGYKLDGKGQVKC